jgi:C-terminal peptidase prc
MAMVFNRSNSTSRTFVALCSFLLVIFSLLNSTQSLAQPMERTASEPDRSSWTIHQFWEETQISFEMTILGDINTKTCLTELNYFLGCIEGFSEVYNFTKKNSLTASEDDKKVVYLIIPDSVAVSEFPGFKVLTFDPSSATFEADIKNYRAQLKNFFENFARMREQAPLVVWTPTFTEAFKALNDLYVIDPKLESYLAATVLNSFFSRVYDPHTYVTPTMLSERRYSGVTTNAGAGNGIFGINFLKIKYKNDEPYYVIRSTVKNSPAANSDLNPGDVVLSANGVTGADAIMKLISDKEVRTVAFEVEGSKGVRTITISRAIFNSDAVEGQLLTTEAGRKMAYIRLESFMDKAACFKIEKLGQEMLEQGAEGVVLDLRDNGGGLVNVALCINELYVEQGSRIFGVKNTGAQEVKYTFSKMNKPRPFKDLVNVTLLNGYSASASEIVGIYLQAYRKSFIVGERSYGKGTMQNTKRDETNPLVTVAFTIAKYYGPQLVSPQIQGVAPDIEAYPFYTQDKPTPYEREGDSYDNAIVADEAAPIVTSDRQQELSQVKDCMKLLRYADKAYEMKDEFKRRVHDHQLAVALATADCAQDERIPVFNRIDIPVAN